MWGTIVRSNDAQHGGSRSTSSASSDTAAAADAGLECVACPAPPPASREQIVEQIVERLERHGHDNPYISRFLTLPQLHAFFSHEGMLRLLGMRKCAKELTEASAACSLVRDLLGEIKGGAISSAGDCSTGAGSSSTGEGMTLLDFCSGKGLTATLLSLLLPDARVIM